MLSLFFLSSTIRLETMTGNELLGMSRESLLHISEPRETVYLPFEQRKLSPDMVSGEFKVTDSTLSFKKLNVQL